MWFDPSSEKGFSKSTSTSAATCLATLQSPVLPGRGWGGADLVEHRGDVDGLARLAPGAAAPATTSQSFSGSGLDYNNLMFMNKENAGDDTTAKHRKCRLNLKTMAAA